LALGLVGLVPVAVRNLLLGSGAFGDRRDAYVSFEGALSNGLQEFGRILVQPETSGLSGVFGVMLAGLLLAGLWIAWLRRDDPAKVVGIRVDVYWCFFWVSQIRTHVDADIERFIIPMMGPMVILALYALLQTWRITFMTLIQRGQPIVARIAQTAAVLLLIIILATNAAKSSLVALAEMNG
jgi:hypothetical protein